MEAQSCGTGSFFQWDTIGWSHAPVARFFDNTGREYSLSEITIPLGTPIVECQAGMFTLVFQDGNNPFFMDMTPDTITGTGTMGDLRRQIACQVFTDISEFLENPLTPSGITGVTPGIPGAMGRCNIQIIAQAGLFLGAAMQTTPLFVVPATTGNFVLANGLVLDTEPQKTIQSGFNSFLQYPNTAPPILNNMFIGPFHGRIEVDININWYYDLNAANNPTSVDYYTAMLHEAMHNLGIIRFAPPFISNFPFSLYSRHTRYLHFDNLPGSPTVITPNANSFWSGFPSSPANIGCNDAGSLFFMGVNNVYAETVSQGMQHHYGCPDIVNGNCVSGLSNLNTFVMGGCTAVGSDYVKRHPNESEKDILCQLGYGFQAHTNGLPEYGTLHTPNSLIRHGYSANCEPPCGVVANCDIASVYYAESVTVSPLLNDNNGANATVNQLVFHTTNAGSFSFDPNTQSVTFTPNGVFSGWAIFSYVPKCSNGEEGNTAFIFIEVIRCECENDPIVVGDPAFPNAVTDLSQSALMNALPAGSCIIVHGILNIDVGFVIPQGCRWIMMPGSRIDVQENITVLPNNLFHGCDAMWQGIRVFKHRLLSMESSRVEDADNGVWVLDWGQISLRNNVFFKNDVGLRFEDPSSSNPLNCVVFALDNNTFHCENATLFPPNAPNMISFAGIVSERYYLIISQRNTFKAMRYGIRSRFGNLVVKNCLFSDIRDNVNPATTDGIGIFQFSALGSLNSLHVYGDYSNIDVEFENCRLGIEATRQHTGIFGCNMENVDIGIQVLQSTNSSHRIYDNEIQCNNAGIDFYLNAPVSNMHIRDNYIHAGTVTSLADAGIRIDDGANTSTNLFIYDNIVDMDYATLGYSITNTSNLNLSNNIANLSCTQPSTGFYLNLSPGTQFSCNRAEAVANCGVSSAGIAVAASNSSTIQCNHTLNTHWGHLYANYTSTNPLLTIRGNTIGDHETGLRYTNSVNFLSQSLQGNLWTGTYSNAGAVHDGANPFTNIYDVSTVSATPICPPTVIVSTNPVYSIAANTITNSLWFAVPTPLGTTFGCSNSGIVCDSSITSLTGGTNPNDYELITGNVQYENYEEESEWAARRDLYDRILNDSTLLQDSLLMTFFYSYQDSSEGQYQEVSYQMNEAFYLQPVTEAQLDILNNQLQTWGDSLIVLDSLLQTSFATSSYLPLIRNLRTIINGLQIQYESILQGIETLRNNTFNYLETQNGLLPSNELYEQNEQIVNEIYLSTLAGGNIDYTVEQIEYLENIANQCPLSGGNAVYKARALYAFISGNSYYNDELLCMQAGVQYKQAQSKQIENAYEIYPNPADNIIQIKQIDKHKGNGNIEIKDSYNRILLSKAIAEDENAWEINTSSLSSGVYFLTVNRSRQGLYAQKVVIIR